MASAGMRSATIGFLTVGDCCCSVCVRVCVCVLVSKRQEKHQVTPVCLKVTEREVAGVSLLSHVALQGKQQTEPVRSHHPHRNPHHNAALC